ncbi:cytochrome c biogenesis protein ResB [Pelagicoccus sp. SDUM812002]|uniref:cytochrome c biogenesis protein ResB n=1 Tax=Pelagicoccus sp. SDUM812002 TaxID=3041266 RepID=UPI00280EC092|nr:cytochrome c biogenesis protein ResB [Pelagicoccus sp. SDUM812002]MDQ8185670.1 cytochrome c biogenesis protein ResB [Pelagicoccus sp. SDUM812002]
MSSVVKKQLQEKTHPVRSDYLIAAAICVSTSLFACGLSIYQDGAPLVAPPWPTNAILLVLVSAWLFFIGLKGQRFAPTRLLGGLPFALCVIAHFFLWVLVAGILPASDGSQLPEIVRLLGLSHPITSIPFNAALILFLLNLGLATAGRLTKLKKARLKFYVSHGGMWLLIAAGLLSSSDLERWELIVSEGNATAQVSRGDGSETRYLPFGVLLSDFSIEFFTTQLTLVDIEEKVIIWQKGEPLIDLETGNTSSIRGWEVEVLRSFPGALPQGDGYQASDSPYAPPAVKLRATHLASGKTLEGWTTCGNDQVPTQTILAEGSDFRFAMALPRPKRFASEITILKSGDEPYSVTVEVNKPIKIDGWELNQLSYDETAGKASRWSVLEAVRDPWIPIVYTGIALLAFGAILHLLDRVIAKRGEHGGSKK